MLYFFSQPLTCKCLTSKSRVVHNSCSLHPINMISIRQLSSLVSCGIEKWSRSPQRRLWHRDGELAYLCSRTGVVYCCHNLTMFEYWNYVWLTGVPTFHHHGTPAATHNVIYYKQCLNVCWYLGCQLKGDNGIQWWASLDKNFLIILLDTHWITYLFSKPSPNISFYSPFLRIKIALWYPQASINPSMHILNTIDSSITFD